MKQVALRGTRASDHLDMIRGLAALAVLYGHARVLLIHSVSDDIYISPISRIFYLLSGYGHSAVIIFFVLSGYLVGGSVVRATASGRWSWADYLLARGVRLYLVLVPALLLTTCWDRIALKAVSDRLGNEDTAIAIITSPQVAAHSGLATFLGNLAFLQTIVVPTYGSNSALWSLSNEAWYYLIFPPLWMAGNSDQTPRRRIAYAAAGLTMLFFVGPRIFALFPVWLLGVGLFLLPRLRMMAYRSSVGIAAIPLMIVLGLITIGKLPNGYLANYCVAFSFSLFMLAILHRSSPRSQGLYPRSAAILANCSYTLYLTHLPILICLRSFWTYERPWLPDLTHWGMVCLVCLGCLVFAFLLALLTEAKTDRVRRFLALQFANEGRMSSLRMAVQDGGSDEARVVERP